MTMRIPLGIILIVVGSVIALFGDRRVLGKGPLGRGVFNLPKLRAIGWVTGGILVYIGVCLVLNKLSWLGI